MIYNVRLRKWKPVGGGGREASKRLLQVPGTLIGTYLFLVISLYINYTDDRM